MMTNSTEPEYHTFEQVVPQGQLGISVGCNLTFSTVSSVDGDKRLLTPVGVLDEETASLQVQVEGDIMPAGFEHDHQFIGDEEDFSPAYLEVWSMLSTLKDDIAETYFEGAVRSPTISIKFARGVDDMVTTQSKSMVMNITGQPNSHPHWSGRSLS